MMVLTTIFLKIFMVRKSSRSIFYQSLVLVTNSNHTGLLNIKTIYIVFFDIFVMVLAMM
jgi:hypothetical protein